MSLKTVSILLVVPAILMTLLFFIMNMDFRIFLATIVLEIVIAIVLSFKKDTNDTGDYVREIDR